MRPWIPPMVALLLVPMTAGARTWRVRADGSGDAPTIPAALDSATAGDDVLVAPGTYTWATQGGTTGYDGASMLALKSGVVLHSEAGPAVTILDAQGQGRVVYCRSTSAATQLEGFTITGGAAIDTGVVMGNAKGWGGGILCTTFGSATIRGNVVRDNVATRAGSGIAVTHAVPVIEDNFILRNAGEGVRLAPAIGPMTLAGNTIHGNAGSNVVAIAGDITVERNVIAVCGGEGVYCGFDEVPILQNVFWQNADGESNCMNFDPAFNLLADPRLCTGTEPPWRILPDSPCLPVNNPWGVRIGAPMDECTVSDVPILEPRRARATWSLVKRRYR